jgi:hypothetical protein
MQEIIIALRYGADLDLEAADVARASMAAFKAEFDESPRPWLDLL